MMEYGGIYLNNMSGNGIDHHFRQMMINQLSSPVESRGTVFSDKPNVSLSNLE